MKPVVHQFESTVDAYTAVNTGGAYCEGHPAGPHDEMGVTQFCDDGSCRPREEHVKDGDVLVVASEGVIGVAVEAWPVAVIAADGQYGEFHVTSTCWSLLDDGKYAASVKLAVETAEADADITGNEHWREPKVLENVQQD